MAHTSARTSAEMIDLIGNTPLVRLRRASEETGCTILGKAEFLNPGQSVKDRAALWIIRDAERRGALRPGGVIVEGTAGNTGIGLALVGNALGYRTVIVIPETQSAEKKEALRIAGAELVEVPAVPYRNPNNYVKLSGRLASELARTEPAVDWRAYPEAETWREMTDRAAQCMERLARRSSPTAIVVSHAGSATAVVKWWLRLPEPMQHVVHFEFRPCSVTELVESEWGERVLVRLNDTAHLRAR